MRKQRQITPIKVHSAIKCNISYSYIACWFLHHSFNHTTERYSHISLLISSHEIVWLYCDEFHHSFHSCVTSCQEQQIFLKTFKKPDNITEYILLLLSVTQIVQIFCEIFRSFLSFESIFNINSYISRSQQN